VTREVLVVGGGYAGLTVARRVSRRGRDVHVTLINPHAYMTYQPLLPEAAAGSVSPAHLVVPLRTALPGVRVVTGALTGLDRERRVAEVTAVDDRLILVPYDGVVLCVGSVTRVPSIPGLVPHALGFRTVEEAVHLNSRVLSMLDLASTLTDKAQRRRALTFVFVGGGYAGVEALAEVEDMVRRNVHRYGLRHYDTRWVLVEVADRILPQLPERLASYTARHLTGRGIEVLTGRALTEVTERSVVLDDATEIATDTVVWTAGVVASPVLARIGLDVDRAGRVTTDEQLHVRDEENVWAIGDCAAVPDVHTSGLCAPTAQHAVRQALVAADNVMAKLDARPLRGYGHRDAGAVASLGLGKGVAELYGVPLRGYPAWLVHRIYHGSRLPCGRRRIQVVLLWLLGSLSKDPVALHALESPRLPMEQAHHHQRPDRV